MSMQSVPYWYFLVKDNATFVSVSLLLPLSIASLAICTPHNLDESCTYFNSALYDYKADLPAYERQYLAQLTAFSNELIPDVSIAFDTPVLVGLMAYTTIPCSGCSADFKSELYWQLTLLTKVAITRQPVNSSRNSMGNLPITHWLFEVKERP